MTEIVNFNQLKQILLEITSANNVTTEMLRDDWSVDYSIDLQEDFFEELRNLQYGMELYQTAMGQGDKLAAKAGLMDVGIASQRLRDFLDCFSDDVNRVYTSKEFDWPEFHEDYKIPKHYNYKGVK